MKNLECRTAKRDLTGELRCPHCGRTLIRRNALETVYLGRLTRFRGDQAIAVCPTCKTNVPVPLRLRA